MDITARHDREREQSTEKNVFYPFKVHKIDCTHSTPYLEKLLAKKAICICSVCVFIYFLLRLNTRKVFLRSCFIEIFSFCFFHCIRIVNDTHKLSLRIFIFLVVSFRKQMINKLLLECCWQALEVYHRLSKARMKSNGT